MKRSTKWAAAAAIALLAGFGCGVVRAEDGAAAAGKRVAAMKRMGDDLKAIDQFGKGESDQAKAVAAAKDIVETQKILPTVFPKGSGSDALPGKSYANPKLWSEWDKFLSDNKLTLDKATALLAKVEAGDKQAAATGPRDLWDNGCQVCHKSYREKKPS